jgi:hypothetical protein
MALAQLQFGEPPATKRENKPIKALVKKWKFLKPEDA